MSRPVRIATKLEVKHYHELIKRLATASMGEPPRQTARVSQLDARTLAVFNELDRFGYIPTKNALLMVVDIGLNDPFLTREQEAAAQADLAYLWSRLS